MNTDRIRKATEKTTVEAIVKYVLAADTDISDAEIRHAILAKAGHALIFDDGDTFNLIAYLRTLAFAENAS